VILLPHLRFFFLFAFPTPLKKYPVPFPIIPSSPHHRFYLPFPAYGKESRDVKSEKDEALTTYTFSLPQLLNDDHSPFALPKDLLIVVFVILVENSSTCLFFS